MKLRILDNSICFRLSVQDLEKLSQAGRISAVLHITPSKQFKYTLQKENDNSRLYADYINDEILFHIPGNQVDDLYSTEKIGVYENIEHNHNSFLKVTIEKDFKCLTPRDEDESGLFPNPSSTHSSC